MYPGRARPGLIEADDFHVVGVSLLDVSGARAPRPH